MCFFYFCVQWKVVSKKTAVTALIPGRGGGGQELQQDQTIIIQRPPYQLQVGVAVLGAVQGEHGVVVENGVVLQTKQEKTVSEGLAESLLNFDPTEMFDMEEEEAPRGVGGGEEDGGIVDILVSPALSGIEIE